MIIWNNEYRGQSPGDLQNKKNGFAGQFSGYNGFINEPYLSNYDNLPIILIMADSILGDFCLNTIRRLFKGIANINCLRHPHHCKNIDTWLETWKINSWKYDIIFYFDGMHGFPNRVTETEYQEFIPLLVTKIKRQCKRLIWCNCTPIPKNFPQNTNNSNNGPNTKEQSVTNESVINRNISIEVIMNKLNIPLIDLYSIMKKIQHLTQPLDNLHFNNKGQIIMGKFIAQNLYNQLKTI